jgi:hypothetical protein
MRRAFLTAFVVGSILIPTVAAHAGVPMPGSSRFMGRSYTEWARAWAQWGLGDGSNPLVAALAVGDCGELMGGVYFVAAPIDLGVELDCDIAPGTPLLISHAGQFTFKDADQTDEELVDQSNDLFVTSTNELTLDGRPLSVFVTNTGAYDVQAESGSLYADVIELGAGPVRTSVTGNFTIVHPLPPGDHTIEAAVDFPLTDEHYSATYHVHVG